MFQVTRESLAPATPQAPPAPRLCDAFANVALIDHHGRRFRFHDAFVDGRALIVNTMFTVCRGTCPGTSATLMALRQKLSPVFGQRLTIVSITLAPHEDDPTALRRYANIYGAARRSDAQCDWRFVTGRPPEIDALRRSLGFYDLNPRVDADITQHGELLLFGNTTTDRWAALPASLRLPLLVETIRRVAGFTFEQKYGFRP